MNTFDEIKLSTLQSIAEIETDVNGLCGTQLVSGLVGNGTGSIEFSSDYVIEKATFKYSDGSYYESIITSNKYKPGDGDTIISIVATDADDVQYNIPLTEGYGENIYDTNENLILTTPVGFWNNEIETNGTWNSKIAIAKRYITDLIKKNFILRGMNQVVYNLQGKDILNFIASPEVFNTASDYYTLFLIYNDLSGGGSNEAYQAKSELYLSYFDKAFETAMILVQIKADADTNSNTVDNLRQKNVIIY